MEVKSTGVSEVVVDLSKFQDIYAYGRLVKENKPFAARIKGMRLIGHELRVECVLGRTEHIEPPLKNQPDMKKNGVDKSSNSCLHETYSGGFCVECGARKENTGPGPDDPVIEVETGVAIIDPDNPPPETEMEESKNSCSQDHSKIAQGGYCAECGYEPKESEDSDNG